MPDNKALRILRKNLLTILTLFAVIGGTVVACIVRAQTTKPWTKREIMYIQFPGELFLRALKAMILPLLSSSVISAIGFLDISLSKKIAMRSIAFYAATTVCAVMLGIALVLIIRPGEGAASFDDDEYSSFEMRKVLTQDTLLDLVRNLIPPNLVQAGIAQSRTNLIVPPDYNETTMPLETLKFVEVYEEPMNVLGIVMFSVIIGIAVGKLGEPARPFLKFFHSLGEISMMITGWIIWASPLGIFFLVLAKVIEIKSFADLVGRLGLYFATVLLGLVLHGFVTLSILFFIYTRRLPFRFIAKLSPVLITAFGTASSSATMPLTIQTLDKMGLDPRITRFVIPIGATINMDGTALYEAVAAIFIAQLRNIPMSFGKTVAVCVTATAASIGAAGIPQAGLVTMVMVLNTVGLPEKDVVTIIAVDWLLDRFRTTINVMCDAICARLVDLQSQGELGAVTEKDRRNADAQELVEITKLDA